MKNRLAFFNILIIVAAFTAKVAGGEPWEVRRDELLKEAEEQYQRKLDETVSPEKLAKANGMPYPVPTPKKNKLVVRSETQDEAKKMANIEFSQERENQVAMKVVQEYSLFNLNDIITVETRIRNGEVVTGKLVAVGRDYVRIGNRMLKMTDLPDDVRDRFFSASCDELQKRKVADAKRKFNAQKSKFSEDKFKELLPKALKDNGYYPKKVDEGAYDYLELDNWQSMQEVFDDILSKARESVGEDLHDEIVDATMKKNGYVYNAIQGQWIPSGQENKAGGGENRKPGLFQKLKGIFGN
ncbi:MAG: hypothetical protein J5833_04040 [Victivallales bacterium]|nr:hypothetical protein [Victivallales bacterium]